MGICNSDVLDESSENRGFHNQRNNNVMDRNNFQTPNFKSNSNQNFNPHMTNNIQQQNYNQTMMNQVGNQQISNSPTTLPNLPNPMMNQMRNQPNQETMLNQPNNNRGLNTPQNAMVNRNMMNVTHPNSTNFSSNDQRQHQPQYPQQMNNPNINFQQQNISNPTNNNNMMMNSNNQGPIKPQPIKPFNNFNNQPQPTNNNFQQQQPQNYSRFIGKWRIKFHSGNPSKIGETIELTGQKVMIEGLEAQYSWIYNEYTCQVVDSNNDKMIFMYNCQRNELIGYPFLRKLSDTIHYSPIGGQNNAIIMNNNPNFLSPQFTLRKFKLEFYKGYLTTRGSVVEITPTEYVNHKYKTSSPITCVHNPYTIEVTFKGGEKWVYVTNNISNYKMYGYPICCTDKNYFGKYTPYYDENERKQMNVRKIRIGFYRKMLLKDKCSLKGMDYVQFKQNLSHEDFEFVHVYKDELLDPQYHLKDHIDVIVMGGGMASSYDKSLTEIGVCKLLNWIKNDGGSYFGICASAYTPTSCNASYRGSNWGWGLVRVDLKDQSGYVRGKNGQTRVRYTPYGTKICWPMFSSSPNPNNNNIFCDVVRYSDGPIFKVLSLEEYKENRIKYCEKVSYEPLRQTILSMVDILPYPAIFTTFETEVAKRNGLPQMVGSPNLVGQDYGNGRVLISSAHFEKKVSVVTLRHLLEWLLKRRN